MHTGLYQRNFTYYLNVRVPVDLVSSYAGKTHLKFSLKTKDPREAVRKVRTELNRLEKEFADFRKRAEQSSALQELRVKRQITSLDDETLGAIAATLLEENLEADDFMRSLGAVGDTEEDNQNLLAILQPAYARGDIKLIEPIANQLVAMLGFELSVDDASWRQFCIKLLETSLQAVQIQSKRLAGEVIPTTAIMATAPKPLEFGDGQHYGQSLTSVLERWKAVADRRRRTSAEMSSLVRRFEEFSERKPVKALTRQHGIGY